VNPFFSHVNVNTTDATPGGTAAQRGDGRTFQTLSRHVYGFFRRRYAHNKCTMNTCNTSTYCTQLKDLSGVVAEISDCRDHRHLLSRPSVPCPSLVSVSHRSISVHHLGPVGRSCGSIISVLWVHHLGPVGRSCGSVPLSRLHLLTSALSRHASKLRAVRSVAARRSGMSRVRPVTGLVAAASSPQAQ
jgi:hypothetical protein